MFLQSGLDEKWSGSMKCCCYLRNVQDLLADGKTLYQRQFGEPFKGPGTPSGAMVEYYPISARDQSRLQFGKKVLLGIFLRCALVTETICKGYILLLDIEKLEKDRRIGNLSSKNQRKRSMNDTKGRQFYFPSCRWYSKIVRKGP